MCYTITGDSSQYLNINAHFAELMVLLEERVKERKIFDWRFQSNYGLDALISGLKIQLKERIKEKNPAGNSSQTIDGNSIFLSFMVPLNERMKKRFDNQLEIPVR